MPESYLEKLTSWSLENEENLKKLHADFQRESGTEIPFLGFCDFMFQETIYCN